jgi:hypothetical protein
VIADPNSTGAPLPDSFVRLSPSAVSGFPRLKIDPRPAIGAHGEVMFVGADRDGTDAIFLHHSDGRLERLVRTRDVTSRGRTLRTIQYGSVYLARDGSVVFRGRLEGAGMAILIAQPARRLAEIAVEGEAAAGGGFFTKAFGTPSIASSADGTIAAFRARTTDGSGLFLYRNGRLELVLATGAPTPLGRVSYISDGKPGLAPDGTVGVRAATDAGEMVLVQSRGSFAVALRSGETAQSGATLKNIGDPWLTRSGAVYFGAADSELRESIYAKVGSAPAFEYPLGRFFEIAASSYQRVIGHAVNTGSLAVNEHGDVAYLGSR